MFLWIVLWAEPICRDGCLYLHIISSSITRNGMVVMLVQQLVMLHPFHYCIQTRVYCIHWILRQSWSCYLHREVIRAFPWLGSIRWFEEKLCYQQTSRLCTPNLRVLHWSWYYMILDGCRQSKNWFDPSEKLMREFLISSELVFLMSKCLGTDNVCVSKKSSASLLRIG